MRKLADYCLDPTHPRGRHKARVFREALGVERSDAPWLRSTLLRAADDQTAEEDDTDSFGTRWRIDVPVTRQEKSAMVRSVWIVRTGDTAARFVTCWVL